MDLDCSFTMVSSLTPSGKPTYKPPKKTINLLSSKKRITRNATLQSERDRHIRKNNKDNHYNKRVTNKNKSLQISTNSTIKEDLSACTSLEINLTNNVANKSTTLKRHTRRNVTQPTSSIIDESLEAHAIEVANTTKQTSEKHCPANTTRKSICSGKNDVVTDEGLNQISNTSKMSEKSSDFVNSLCTQIDSSLIIGSNLKETRKSSVPRISGSENTSLSSAYDSESFTNLKKHSVIIIQETPESDRCSNKSTSDDNLTERAGKMIKDGVLLSSSCNSLKTYSQSSLISDLNKKCSLKDISNDKVDNYQLSNEIYQKNVAKDNCNLNITNEEEVQNDCLKKLNSITFNPIFDREECNSSKIIDIHKTQNSNNEVQKCDAELQVVKIDPPPEEVWGKYDRINHWLDGAQQNSIIVLSSDSSFNSPKKIKKKIKKKSKRKESLSPRLIQKLKDAHDKVKEEQKVFEELFGSNVLKRLSDDLENQIEECSQETIDDCERLLNGEYGTDWRRDEVLPQSEPRKGKPRAANDKKAPQTERKKHRTSISSSSSEDRFEDFLSSLRRGKSKTTLDKRPGTPDFINDTDSDCDTSLTFYQNIISSAVKSETELPVKPKNRRRLSFGSSQEDCSEPLKPKTKPIGKAKKDSANIKNKDSDKTKQIKGAQVLDDKTDYTSAFPLVTPLPIKTKKKKNIKNKDYDNTKQIDGAQILDDKSDYSSGFTLVTPLPIKTKKKNKEPETDLLSGSNLKTPKNRINKDAGSGEDLADKHLYKDGFKVPKQISSLKTPIKLTGCRTPASPALSFLSSLSEFTAGLPCHPDSLVYKNNFKEKKEELSKKLFSLFNREVFDNQLPAGMVIEWSTRMRKTSGLCFNKRIYTNCQVSRTARIQLSTKILDRADRLRDTLIHELCHAATWIIDGASDGHGPKWKAWANKANRRFPELPMIKRCHDYEISTKYTYKCVNCGYSIGRHSKSLNTDRKRCGYCYGKFEVFLTSKLSTASERSKPRSDKTHHNPTGFALFVKENYATVKRENNMTGKRHGEVMKLLSQKFAEVKLSNENDKEPPLLIE